MDHLQAIMMGDVYLIPVASAIMLICSFIVTAYAFTQFYLMMTYKVADSKKSYKSDESQLPRVTIQLPIFNEVNVVEQLLEHIFKLDYPLHLLDIQILDDSNDETSDIIQRVIEKYQATGRDVQYLHRADRQGYKAGALDAGMQECKGTFIAIFDADFMPSPDFLLRILPYFDDKKIGMVQSRWQFYNESENILTSVQALQLNVHFTIEQSSRSHNQLFSQFNGTAGVWRKETIIASGGWQYDTLTEDLDLSYRAQLNGWTMRYVSHIDSPCELPSDISALKTQQYRWMKGGSETAKKLLRQILKSHISFFQKWHGIVHLLSSSIYIPILIYGLLSVPVGIHYGLHHGHGIIEYQWLSWSLILLIPLYYIANILLTSRKQSLFFSTIYFLIKFPIFLSLSMGLTWHNAMAVFKGWQGNMTPFERTPKSGIQPGNYTREKKSWPRGIVGEGILMCYFGIAVWFNIYNEYYAFLLFHAMLYIGYTVIFLLSLFSINKSEYAS